MRTAESRESFAQSHIEFFKQYPIFTGVDLDWEYPSRDGNVLGEAHNIAHKDDQSNYIEFLKLLRRKLQENGFSTYTVSMCTSGGASNFEIDLMKIDPYMDEWHIMAYDYHGHWEPLSGHLAPMNEIVPFVDHFLSLGVDPKKVFLGSPLYVRQYPGHASSKPGSTYTKPNSDTAYLLKQLPSNLPDVWDDENQATYSYDSSKMELYSYESPRSLELKINDLVLKKNLGGVFFWEVAQDRPVGAGSLIEVAYKALNRR